MPRQPKSSRRPKTTSVVSARITANKVDESTATKGSTESNTAKVLQKNTKDKNKRQKQIPKTKAKRGSKTSIPTTLSDDNSDSEHSDENSADGDGDIVDSTSSTDDESTIEDSESSSSTDTDENPTKRNTSSTNGKEGGSKWSKDSVSETNGEATSHRQTKQFLIPKAPDVIAALRLVELNPKGGGVLKDGKTVYPYKKRDLAKYLGLKEDSMSIRDLKGEIGSLLDKRFRFRFHYAWGKYTPASRDSLIYTIQQRYIKKPQHKWAKDYFKVRKLLSTMATDRRRGYRERKRLEGSWDRKMKQHCACGPNSISIFRNVGRPLKDGERYDFYSSDDFSDSDMPVSASARRPLPHDAPQGGKLSTQQKRIAEKTAKKNSATKRSAKRVRSGPIQVESDSPGPDSESGSQSAAQSDDDQDPLSWSSSSKEDESSDEEDTEKAHTTRVALSSSDSEDENGETSSDESSIPSGAEEEEDVEEEEEEADVADDEEEQENEELAFEVFAPEEWESGTESQESDDPEGLDDSAEVGHGVPASPTSGIKPSNKTETSDNKGLPSPTTLLVPIAFAKTWEKISASQAPQSITKQQSRNTNYDSSSSVIHLASPDTHRGTSSKLHTPRLLPAKSKSKRTDTKKNNLLNSDKSQQSQRQPKSSDLPSSFDPDLGTSKRGRKRTFSKAGRDLILEEHKKKKKLKQSKKNAELKNKRKETAKSLMDTYGDLRSGDIETDEDPTHTRTRTKKSKK